ncbi:hypothetical protein PM082_011636 [Marasmius tenuissimus]|nr:hypothetical protein PM082_011636 [Marasmius tenuissimus]
MIHSFGSQSQSSDTFEFTALNTLTQRACCMLPAGVFYGLLKTPIALRLAAGGHTHVFNVLALWVHSWDVHNPVLSSPLF